MNAQDFELLPRSIQPQQNVTFCVYMSEVYLQADVIPLMNRNGALMTLDGVDDMFPPTALLVLGSLVAFGAIGGVMLYLRSIYGTLDVRKHGKRVSAIVTKINAELVLLTKGEYTTAYFVYATWKDPEAHKVYNFKSKAGGIYLPINHPPGSSIDVLIDPKNPRRYEVMLRVEERISSDM